MKYLPDTAFLLTSFFVNDILVLYGGITWAFLEF